MTPGRSREFDRCYADLEKDEQRTVDAKLARLLEDRRHPSLRLQRRCKLHWRIVINTSSGVRLVYVGDEEGNPRELVFVGGHDKYMRWLKTKC